MEIQAKEILEHMDWEKLTDELGIEAVSYCEGLMRQGRYWEAEDFLRGEIEADEAMHYPDHSGIG